AARASRKQLRHLHTLNPAARLAVTGCWATLDPTGAAAQPGVALVAPNAQKDLLHTLLEPWSAEFDDPTQLARLQPDGDPFDHPAASNGRANGDPSESAIPRTRAFIKVQDGCNNRCTFCIVTVARGASRSRTLADLVQEVRRLSEQGVQEAVLTGVHLGSYGRDLSAPSRSDLKRLVSALLEETPIARLRLSSLEPWELADGFFDLWRQAPDRLCPHLHLPLQEGADPQLRRMARRCTTDSFRDLVQMARSAIPDLVLTTDLIVGFPGESEADFEDGLAFVGEMRFTHAHIFPFSARAGTAAASFADQVPAPVKKERSRRVHPLG
ncbi:MAG TPA: MiaB/RimO family radical SAM methylthiotransferase, partial [Caldilineaceae bacterium]|nr:MiaB/RimO family radical SAM methylthiotransferase [Caldilineaceae bacterium]